MTINADQCMKIKAIVCIRSCINYTRVVTLVQVIEVLEQNRSCWIDNNKSMSRTFRSGDLSQLVQQTKLT